MIVCVEGLKGSGKSTLAGMLHEMCGFPVARKYSKPASPPSPSPLFLEMFREKNQESFKDLASSLGLDRYANFFKALEPASDAVESDDFKSDDAKNIIFDRGIVSLGYAGYYGYAHTHDAKTLPFARYETLLLDLHSEALHSYACFLESMDQTALFLMINCSREIAERRLRARPYLAPSDAFFLDNYNRYSSLAASLERNAQELLPSSRSRFIHVRNETEGDLCSSQGCMLHPVPCLMRS